MPMLERGSPANIATEAPALRSFEFVNEMILGIPPFSAAKYRLNSPDAIRQNRSKSSLFESQDGSTPQVILKIFHYAHAAVK